MIKIKALHKNFGNLEVLRGINISISHGEVVSILGGSGSGKSTLIRCINGLEKVTSGSITVDEYDVADKKQLLNVRKKCSTVFQQFDLYPHLSVLDNITLAPINVLGEKKIEANKQLKVWKFPKILMVTFKRFNENRTKNNTLIDFPLENLDVSKYCVGYEKKVVYDCIGVCNHSGGTNGGHYYAYCLCNDGQWRVFNDASVKLINKENVVSQSAYVVFYRKRE